MLADPFPWHPVAVHVPLGLLSAGLAAEVAVHFAPRERRWLHPAASALLWAGTAGLWVAAVTGFLPGIGTPSPAVPGVLAEHRFLGLWSTGLFSGLSLWRRLSPRRAQALFAIAWLASCVTLWGAAERGIRWVHRTGLDRLFF